MPMALQTSQMFIEPQCSCHFTSEKFPTSSLYTSLNLTPAKSLSFLGIVENCSVVTKEKLLYYEGQIRPAYVSY
jgi:hypothetical protein